DLTRRQKLFDWTLIVLGLVGTVLGLLDAMSRISEPVVPELSEMTEAPLDKIAANITLTPEAPLPGKLTTDKVISKLLTPKTRHFSHPTTHSSLAEVAVSNLTQFTTQVAKQTDVSEMARKVMNKLKAHKGGGAV
ncbi:hypothetical protein ElyMa_006808300, partial [Elysia marginata]